MAKQQAERIISNLELYQISVSSGHGLEGGSRPLSLVLKIACANGSVGWGKLLFYHTDPHFDLIHWSRRLDQVKGKTVVEAFELVEEMKGTWCFEKVQLAKLALRDLLPLSRHRFCPEERLLMERSQAYYCII